MQFSQAVKNDTVFSGNEGHLTIVYLKHRTQYSSIWNTT